MIWVLADPEFSGSFSSLLHLFQGFELMIENSPEEGLAVLGVVDG